MIKGKPAYQTSNVNTYFHVTSFNQINMKSKLDVCVREGGPSFPSAIPGCNVPLGLFLTEVPDLVGAMAACPSPSSVCHE